MRVLLFCPTHRLEPETIDSIFRLDEVGPMDIVFTRDNPHGDRFKDVMYNYRKGRELMLDGGYDAMLTVESDMILPPDALTSLDSLGADVASGLYLFRHGVPMLNALRIEGKNQPGRSLTLAPDELNAAWDAGVVEVSGAGLGCTLIRRRVLEEIDFNSEPHRFCDWNFAAECLQKGYQQLVDFDVRCGHKCPDSWILWPDRDDGFKFIEGELSPYNMPEVGINGVH